MPRRRSIDLKATACSRLRLKRENFQTRISWNGEIYVLSLAGDSRVERDWSGFGSGFHYVFLPKLGGSWLGNRCTLSRRQASAVRTRLSWAKANNAGPGGRSHAGAPIGWSSACPSFQRPSANSASTRPRRDRVSSSAVIGSVDSWLRFVHTIDQNSASEKDKKSSRTSASGPGIRSAGSPRASSLGERHCPLVFWQRTPSRRVRLVAPSR